MWTLVQDRVRRNWRWLTLWSLLFASHVFLSAGWHVATNGRWVIYLYYAYYAVLAFAIVVHDDSNIIQIWRTLPFRESALANLAWGMAVLVPAVFSFLIILLMEFMRGSRFGMADLQSIAWPFLFLLLATLITGLITFVSASNRLACARAVAARNPQQIWPFSSSYTGRTIFMSANAVLLAVCAGTLLLYPTPSRWTDFGPSHLAGMVLAAWMTWKSYRLRFWLLRPSLAQGGLIPDAPSPEKGPQCHRSALAALAQELRTTVRDTLGVLLILVGIGYLVFFCITRTGLLSPIGGVHDSFAGAATFGLVIGATMLAVLQLARLSMLGVVRSLPVTSTQCILLLLSYPYVVSLGIVPCVALFLWLAGHGPLPTLLLAGILLAAGLCPFGMLIAARFGFRGLIWIIAVVGFCAGPGQAIITLVVVICAVPGHAAIRDFNLLPTLLSTPGLCVAVLVLTVLGGVGYWGLRHLVENSSDVYRRNIFPQQPGQR